MSDIAVTIEPLGDRVLIRPLEKEQVTASGIVIPDTADKEKPSEGEILALGKGGIPDSNGKPCANPEEFLKVGDKVLFGKYAGTDVKIEDEDYLIMREDDVLGVIEK